MFYAVFAIITAGINWHLISAAGIGNGLALLPVGFLLIPAANVALIGAGLLYAFVRSVVVPEWDRNRFFRFSVVLPIVAVVADYVCFL